MNIAKTSLLLFLLLSAEALSTNSYDICFVGANGPACFILETDKEINDIVTSVEYPNGDLDVTIVGVDIRVRCQDNDDDGADDNCTIAVKAEEYVAAGTVISSSCSGTTLLVKKADGQGGTYTDPQMNSTQCGYVAPDDDPCYNGSWYVGQGNPLCEDVDTGYKKYCPNGVVSTGNYVLTTPENCR